MPDDSRLDGLGDPHIRVAGLRVWVHGRQFPDAVDSLDGNWLFVTAHCRSPGASVVTGGALLEVTDIERWGQESALLLEGHADRSSLDPLEPELSARMERVDSAGHLLLRVRITPDHLHEEHTFTFDIDQSYLPELIRACEAVVREYPPR